MRRDDPATHATASGAVGDPHPRWGAAELARALGLNAPTPEQVAVIESPLRPLLVVAGAGSGKTETMASRVVWLVANDLVRPDEVLGLTFTRKAAGELSERLSARLATLREAGIWAPKDEDGAVVLDDVPTVSTYHAYAGRIVREHGVRLGVEAESRLLSEAAAWQAFCASVGAVHVTHGRTVSAPLRQASVITPSAQGLRGTQGRMRRSRTCTGPTSAA